MTPDEVQRAFEPWRKMHSRSAWLPSTSDTHESSSFFGGTPRQSSSDLWPLCSQCKKPMQFFLQVDLSTLPENFTATSRTGLLQLFYCATDDGTCDTWQPFSGAQELRLFDHAAEITRPEGSLPLEKKYIVSWKKFSDTPHPEEHEQCGVSYDYDFDNDRVSVTCTDPALKFENLDIRCEVAELISNSAAGDKLGGWPYWIQGVEYPECPRCQSKMVLIMQIDSEDNLAYMFGDMGCGHITQCEKHPQVLAFGWACS